MKTMLQMACLAIFVFLTGCTLKAPVLDTKSIHSRPIIADHRSVDLSRIPEGFIDKAKKDFGIAYGHTSHGSQIISGMHQLVQNDRRFSFGPSGSHGLLTLFDREPRGDLGNPNRVEWERRTRQLLDKGWGDINVVMWSWCGQASSATIEDINLYLDLMQKLEEDYPGVVFIYMTGHLDGSGKNGNLHERNEQIRQFCRDNNKILFDFADIERFDPDGNDFLSKNADDSCNYMVGDTKKNWARDWCERNPGQCTEYGCAHSQPLNCDRKAAAFWSLMAQIAGWYPETKL